LEVSWAIASHPLPPPLLLKCEPSAKKELQNGVLYYNLYLTFFQIHGT
jgi:hypothetical protein